MDGAQVRRRSAQALAEIGARLRAERERRGWTVADIESRSHIRAAYIDALEVGAPERLPAEVYVKGFLRSYADHLGLDGTAVLEAYKRAARPGAEAAAPSVKRPPPAVAGRGDSVGRGNPSTAARSAATGPRRAPTGESRVREPAERLRNVRSDVGRARSVATVSRDVQEAGEGRRASGGPASQAPDAEPSRSAGPPEVIQDRGPQAAPVRTRRRRARPRPSADRRPPDRRDGPYVDRGPARVAAARAPERDPRPLGSRADGPLAGAMPGGARPGGAALRAASWGLALVVVAAMGFGGYRLAGHWFGVRSPSATAAPPGGASGAPTASGSGVSGTTSTPQGSPGAGQPAAATPPPTQTPPARGVGAAKGAHGVLIYSRLQTKGWVTTFRVSGARHLDVVLTATGRLWLRRWVDGAPTYTDALLQPGQSVHVVAGSTLRVMLGNTHVAVRVNGVPDGSLPKQNLQAEWLFFQIVGHRGAAASATRT